MKLDSGKYQIFTSKIDSNIDWNVSIVSKYLSEKEIEQIYNDNLQNNSENIEKKMIEYVYKSSEIHNLMNELKLTIDKTINSNRYKQHFLENFTDTIISIISIKNKRVEIYRELIIEDEGGDLDKIKEKVISYKELGIFWTWDSEQSFTSMQYNIDPKDKRCIRLRALPKDLRIDLDESLTKNMLVIPSQRELRCYGTVVLTHICQCEDYKCLYGKSNINNGLGIIKYL